MYLSGLLLVFARTVFDLIVIPCLSVLRPPLSGEPSSPNTTGRTHYSFCKAADQAGNESKWIPTYLSIARCLYKGLEKITKPTVASGIPASCFTFASFPRVAPFSCPYFLHLKWKELYEQVNRRRVQRSPS